MLITLVVLSFIFNSVYFLAITTFYQNTKMGVTCKTGVHSFLSHKRKTECNYYYYENNLELALTY